ncbi:hypothetical protein L249_7090 [Ophiocordyceps polyrhachis-furcata BCC 54312]|uniref:Uncharacterized protein n=1 Tax=Ophiocordyceps polyrhachis-furcata BCC 54312 TaxID=1330021 RepID=A0A367LLE6_9HYPO|nr:hypothetical protein L249_7090 [Ophiocordyceps polyrhachis-furcata BCC 54312]
MRIEEELKAGEVIVGRYDRYWYSASIAYSAPIDVTAALCRDQSGAMTAIGTARRSLPTVTQGVVAGLRSNWYNLFQMKKYALYSS